MSQGVLNLTPTAEVLINTQPILGEGPFFEAETNQLLWVDIDGCTINLLSLETLNNRTLKLPTKVSAVIPIEGSSNLLATVGRKFCVINRENGAILEELETVDDDKPENRLNDAKCDMSGRLWAGTMGHEEVPGKLKLKQGTLYSYSRGSAKAQVPGVSISNGLGWTLDNKKMYYIDSLLRQVNSFDFDLASGEISNRQVFADFAKAGLNGFPDGMCTDSEGRVYVASFGNGSITCWSPSGELLMRIEMPGARNITSCCFGGPDYSWLLITSARYAVDDFSSQPNSGAVFVIKDLGVKGLPASKFKKN